MRLFFVFSLNISDVTNVISIGNYLQKEKYENNYYRRCCRRSYHCCPYQTNRRDSRACRSVLQTMNVTSLMPRSYIWFTALPPAPPTPKTIIMEGLFFGRLIPPIISFSSVISFGAVYISSSSTTSKISVKMFLSPPKSPFLIFSGLAAFSLSGFSSAGWSILSYSSSSI